MKQLTYRDSVAHVSLDRLSAFKSKNLHFKDESVWSHEFSFILSFVYNWEEDRGTSCCTVFGYKNS